MRAPRSSRDGHRAQHEPVDRPGVFKSPQCREDLKPEHDLFIQHLKLKNTLRVLMGEEVLDHSGLDYYDPSKTSAAAPAPKPAPRKAKKALAGR